MYSYAKMYEKYFNFQMFKRQPLQVIYFLFKSSFFGSLCRTTAGRSYDIYNREKKKATVILFIFLIHTWEVYVVIL